MKTIIPVIHDKEMVFYGQSGLSVKRIFGINTNDFLHMHEKLVNLGLKVRIENAGIMVDFVLYTNALMNNGAEVDIIIREFNQSQKGDGTDLAHALSLSKLYYHYWKSKYDVHVQKTHKSISTADLIINGVKCDLKVRLDQTSQRMKKHNHLLLAGKQDKYYEIYSNEIRSLQEDLKSAFSSRVEEGFNQADCVILDLSNHFHSWNYHRLKSMERLGTIHGLSNEPIPAISKSCILFSPNNARNLNITGFHPQAFWGYLKLMN